MAGAAPSRLPAALARADRLTGRQPDPDRRARLAGLRADRLADPTGLAGAPARRAGHGPLAARRRLRRHDRPPPPPAGDAGDPAAAVGDAGRHDRRRGRLGAADLRGHPAGGGDDRVRQPGAAGVDPRPGAARGVDRGADGRHHLLERRHGPRPDPRRADHRRGGGADRLRVRRPVVRRGDRRAAAAAREHQRPAGRAARRAVRPAGGANLRARQRHHPLGDAARFPGDLLRVRPGAAADLRARHPAGRTRGARLALRGDLGGVRARRWC